MDFFQPVRLTLGQGYVSGIILSYKLLSNYYNIRLGSLNPNPSREWEKTYHVSLEKRSDLSSTERVKVLLFLFVGLPKKGLKTLNPNPFRDLD